MLRNSVIPLLGTICLLSYNAECLRYQKAFVSLKKFSISTTLAIASCYSLVLPSGWCAEESPMATPSITSKAFLDVSINRGTPGRINIGLYGNEAPTGTKIFLSICSGDYDEGVSYDMSQISRIQKDKRIDVNKFALGSAQKQKTVIDSTGRIRLANFDRASMAVNNDVNTLTHNKPGILSVPKGGKSFQFTIAPRPNKELDKENLVIGEVLDGMDVVEKINQVPVSREDILGTKGAFSSAGKGFDPRAKLATVNKPLQKVQIVQCKVEETASIASFLKY